MPIEPSVPITAITQDEFHAIDKVMLGHAFAIHNEFGRLLDEQVYKAELAARCLKSGFDVKREVLIRVRHQTFIKDYFIDLLVSDSTIIEAKTAKVLTDAHLGQAINYLLLAGTHHGSLVNFRPLRVRREFLSTRLTHLTRTQFGIDDQNWPRGGVHGLLREVAVAFCSDVGIGLALYRDAFASLLQILAVKPVPIMSASQIRGYHEMHLLNQDIGLAVSALPTKAKADYGVHLQRLLSITPLSSIAWVNLRIGRIEFTSVNQQPRG